MMTKGKEAIWAAAAGVGAEAGAGAAVLGAVVAVGRAA